MPTGAEQRTRALDRLREETFDLLVIGAGIVGARVALEAARAGASVALLDAGDFGSATSSASSKLIHGGLRYLQMNDYGLVREAHRERQALLDRVAPNLVWPLRFVLPVYRGGPHSVPTIAAGMLTYSTLSGFRHSRTRMVGADAARRLVPPLNTDGLSAAGIFEDAQTNDSRLVLATVKAAARAGAAVLNHLAVTGLQVSGGRVTGARAGELLVRARATVNAAGPWVDAVRKFEDPQAQPVARLSKGVHVVVDPCDEPWGAGLTTPLPDGRVTFALPWEGMLLLGTTDTEYTADPAAVSAEPDDVETVMREAAVALPSRLLTRDRIRYTFAGLRVLPRGVGSTARAPREELIQSGRYGMVSVAGGKLTTHRRIALRVLQHMEAFRTVRLSSDPLPGAGPLPGRPPEVEQSLWAHLTHLYGSDSMAVLKDGAGAPVHAAGPDVWAQVLYALDHEWAVTVEDVVRRRTTLAVRGLATPEVREAIDATLAERGVFKTPDGS
ncbi:MAG: glycerol-3-phosphate dehydrogenase/oxidase [Candidatus Dormibacteraeota bacterium]|nr:glycerol-3-phosphate dehydrogenase/oxidase [Candidatus Dormibacteraeota bacterium]